MNDIEMMKLIEDLRSGERNMAAYTRQGDEELLMQFAEDQGWDEPDLIEALERLRECHKKRLQDYSIPFDPDV